MLVLIPSESPTIIPEVYDSIVMQDEENLNIRIVECNYDKTIKKMDRIVLAKMKCLEEALTDSSDFVVFHDSDILDFRPNNFRVMKEFLIKNVNYGAVSLLRDRAIPKVPGPLIHICNSVMMVRKEALNSLRFDGNKFFSTCHSVYHSLKRGGFLYDYVDDVVRIQHLSKHTNKSVG